MDRRALVGILLFGLAGQCPVLAAAPFNPPAPAPSARTISTARSEQRDVKRAALGQSPVHDAEATTSPRHWKTLAKSVEGRPIEFAQFGKAAESQDSHSVLVIGPLAGDQAAGVDLVDRLAVHFERFPRRLGGVRLSIVRDPNPDGRARHQPGNAHSVELDRNFHTAGWRKVPFGSYLVSGREPNSEPETRALTELITDLRPDRTLLLTTSPGAASLTYAGPVTQAVGALGMAAHVSTAPLSAAAQGTLAGYAGAEQSIATVVLNLPCGPRAEDNWSKFKPILLSAIACDWSSAEAASQSAMPGASSSRVLTSDELRSGGVLVPVIKPRARSKIPQLPPRAGVFGPWPGTSRPSGRPKAPEKAIDRTPAGLPQEPIPLYIDSQF